MRLSQKINSGLLFIGLFFTIFSASAQKDFKYSAPIRQIDSSGFYKISLQPLFIAKSNADLSDIRITDQKGNFVPYVTANNLPQPDDEKFIVFPGVSIASKIDTGTSFVIENRKNLAINMLWIKLKNAAVKRTINLYGSDNLKRWFAIMENIPLQEAGLNSDGAYLQSLSFPASNYHYLKLLVNDKNKAPVKFLEAGIYTEQSVANKYFQIPGAIVTKKGSNKTTYLTIKLNDNYLINEVSLDITAPKYYKRDVAVYQGDKENYQLVSNAELSPDKNSVLLDAKTNKLQLQIDNGDNLPLTIKKAEVSQADQYVVSYLEAGQSYKLLTGNTKASAPDYDLKFFTDSIHGHIPEISHGGVVKNIGYHMQMATVKPGHTLIIWTAIIISLLLLSLLTWKMMNEVKSKSDNS